MTVILFEHKNINFDKTIVSGTSHMLLECSHVTWLVLHS